MLNVGGANGDCPAYAMCDMIRNQTDVARMALAFLVGSGTLDSTVNGTAVNATSAANSGAVYADAAASWPH